MYAIDSRDSVLELRGVPQSSVGAPLPRVLADEHRVLLAYLMHAREPWLDSAAGEATSHAFKETAALVDFVHPKAHYFGPPNDEAIAGHPLWDRGLHSYGAFEVHDSSWLRELERRNRVHPRHNAARYARLHHFIFAFHDSIFECIAEGIRVTKHEGPLLDLLPEMSRRLAEGPAV